MKQLLYKIFIALILIAISLLAFKYVKHNIQNNIQNGYTNTVAENKPTIGILSIALGRYIIYWKEFYESGEKYLLPGYKKQYFLFTDSTDFPYKDAPNVTVIPTKNVKWPMHAMLRYDFFLSQREKLEKFDYLFFFNMDFLFKKTIGSEILPNEEHDGLVFVHHCVYKGEPNILYPYEKNPRSAGSILPTIGKVYVPGGINGGMTKEFFKYCEYCSKNAHIDIRNGIIPRWHDEAYTNKYILDKNPLILPVNYMWTPSWHCPFQIDEDDIKAEIRDKIKYGGRHYLRGETNIKSTPLLRFKYRILSKLIPQKELKEKYKKIYDYWSY